MLNEAPNNNDIKRVANIVLDEAPNSSDATHRGINVCLTATAEEATESKGGHLAKLK